MIEEMTKEKILRRREVQKRYRKTHPDYQKDWRKKNIEKVRKITRKSQIKAIFKLKTEIYALLGNKCVVCGFSDWKALQIDHVHGDGRKDRESYQYYYAYLKDVLKKIKTGSKDYQLLCANHNSIKRFENGEGSKVIITLKGKLDELDKTHPVVWVVK